MKRIIALLITAALFCTALSGCTLGNNLTAFELYSKNAALLAEANGAEVDIDVKMNFDSELLADMDTNMKMNLKYKGEDSQFTVNYPGTDQVIVTTIIGDDTYVCDSSSGLKIHTVNDMDIKESNAESMSNMVPELAESLFEGIEIVENEDGTRTITVYPEPDALEAFTSELMGAASESGADMSLSDIVMTMTFNEDDNMTDMTAAMNIVFSMSGIEIGGKVEYHYTMINIGTAPEILPPEDIDEYVDVDTDLNVEQ